MSGPVLIAGGGIAGMAAALGLVRAGWAVRVFEQAPALDEVGAGLQVSPNAMRALDWLGVGAEVRRAGFRPGAAVMRDGRSGREIYRAPLGDAAEARWGAPYLHLHRADLLAILTEGARAAGVEIVTGARVLRVMERAHGVRLTISREDAEETAEGAVAIGADGLRSALRQQINGAEDPDFTGLVAWRALVPTDRLPPGLIAPEATVWVGPGRHVVTYLLRDGRLINLVAVEEQAEWAAEGWRHKGDPARLRAAFQGWHAAVEVLLAAVDAPFVWGLFTRPEQVRWTTVRIALAGDAAHPMQPFMAQGAAQALEDAVVLARLLVPGAAVSEALAAYERARWSRAARVQARSRANGRLFHRRSRLGRLVHHGPVEAVSRLAPSLAASRLDWLYGHDVTT